MVKTIEFDNLHGDKNGKKLFVVTIIDSDDSEDSKSELWLANDEDHLYELVKEKCVGDDEEEDEFMIQAFEDDWGFTILSTEVGKVAK